MVVIVPQYLNSIASFLNVKLDKTNLKNSKEKSTTVAKTIFDLIHRSDSDYGPINNSEKAEILQWIEYTLVYAVQIDGPQHMNIILNELNSILATKTYLVAHRLTVADALLFFIVFTSMESLSYLEKEKYLNVCRWFDNLQQESCLRQPNKLIDFSTNYLATIAPARH